MRYDFDKAVNRQGTSCLKYDFALKRKGRDDLLPLWVADMDFALPTEVIEDLMQAVTHGVFGYTDPLTDYFQAVATWYQKQFNWHTKEEWVVVTPGVMFAVALAIRAYTSPGDGVLVQQPVYYPFAQCTVDNGRHVVNNQLVYNNGRYTIDFEDFEQKIIVEKVKLFVLCSPHNPVGRVWTRDELFRMGEICIRHNVIVVADEIHSDFVYPGHQHYVFAGLNEAFAQNSIICTSPSKTFNLAGLQVSNIFIPNPLLRKAFIKQRDACGYSQMNTMGLVAAKSVYQKGYPWYQELKTYLNKNLDFATQYIRTHIPGIEVIQPEGTYLLWLDCKNLGLDPAALEHLVLEDAKLWLDSGAIFGLETTLFQRINYACTQQTLLQALTQLEQAVAALSTN